MSKKLMLAAVAMFAISCSTVFAQSKDTDGKATRKSQKSGYVNTPTAPTTPTTPTAPTTPPTVQTPTTKPVRKVLYTMQADEEIYWGEYSSNFKLSNFRFACTFLNKRDTTYTLYNNGSKLTADMMYVHHLVPGKMDSCIVEFYKGKQAYLKLNSKIFGPYEQVSYEGWYPKVKYGMTNTQYAYPNRFWFRQMGQQFEHRQNGTIGKANGNQLTFLSPNGTQKAIMTQDQKRVTVGGRTYTLPFPSGVVTRGYNHEVCILNDGTTYVSVVANDTVQNRNLWYAFLIKQGKVTAIDIANDYFDIDTRTVRTLSSLSEFNAYPNYEKLKWGYNQQRGSYIAYDFTLQDKTGTHLFTARWDYDYVMIDGLRFGDQCPIEAFYDSASNAFAWTVVEGKQIVLYTYSLN